MVAHLIIVAIIASAVDAVFRKSLLPLRYDVEVHHHAGGVMFED
jgi:hypothetical protein